MTFTAFRRWVGLAGVLGVLGCIILANAVGLGPALICLPISLAAGAWGLHDFGENTEVLKFMEESRKQDGRPW